MKWDLQPNANLTGTFTGITFMKLKLIAAAAAMVVAGSANAAIGALAGNGELFFNIWDSTGSATLALTLPTLPTATANTITTFESAVAAGTTFSEVFNNSVVNSFIAGVANTANLQWNITAFDGQGANRLLSTYTVGTNPLTTQPIPDDSVIRSAVGAGRTFVGNVNIDMGTTASAVKVASSAASFAGGTGFGSNIGGNLNYSTAGTLGNSSFASGLGFWRVDALSTGTAAPTYTQYLAGGANAVHAWVNYDAANGLTLTVAAVPEPETFAMLIAGLGLMGALARRRRMSV
jgi:hypothetical protein